MWFFVALLSSAFYAVAEAMDNFFANKEFKHPMTLVFFASIFNIFYIPILVFTQHPELPPLHTLPIFILLGFVNVGYLYPYYKGLKEDDTSVAIAFLAIERIMVPILAFFIVGEILYTEQYLGILLIVIAVFALGLHHAKKKFRLSKGVWYISCAALFLAFEGVLLKVLFNDGVSVATAVGGESLFSMIFGLSLFFHSKIRKDIIVSVPLFLRMSPLFFIEEAFTFLGLYAEGWAISHTSVSVVKGITMVSPFFLIFFAWFGRGLFPSVFKENLHKGKVFKKVLLFVLIIVGIMLVKE